MNTEPVKHDPDKPATSLGPNTKISFSLLLLAAPFFIGLVGLYYKMDSIQKDIRKSWTIPHQTIWAERMKSQNATLIVPSVFDVVNTIDASSKSGAP